MDLLATRRPRKVKHISHTSQSRETRSKTIFSSISPLLISRTTIKTQSLHQNSSSLRIDLDSENKTGSNSSTMSGYEVGFPVQRIGYMYPQQSCGSEWVMVK